MIKNIFNINHLIKTKKLLVIFLLFIIIASIIPIESIFAEDLTWGDLTPEQQAQVIKRSTPLGQITSGLSDAINWAAGGLVSMAANKMILAFAQFFGNIIQLEAKFLAWIIDGISGFTTLEIVQTGWKICRDFANLFFIAILIYIAFATILRLQKVDAKKMLFKVITMAIIINFSLMIGGIIIDFSQVMFKYFIFAGLTEKNGVGFGEALGNQLKLQTFFGNEYSNVNSGVLPQIGNVFLKLLFILSFFALVTIFFGALVITLFIRNFWLWILLILSPLAWFLGIVPVPMLSKYASEWWRNFIKWAFMAPIMGFFIFLSFQISVNSNIIDKEKVEQWKAAESSVKGSEQMFGFSKESSSIFNVSNVLYLFITLGFLIGGLMAGQSLGSGAAKGALSMINKAGKNTQKWMGRKAMQTAPVRKAGNVLMGMGNIPIVGGVFKRAGMATQRGTSGAKGEDLKNAENRIKYMNNDQLKKNFDSFNDREKQAAAKKLGNENLDQKQFEAMQKIYSKQGYEKELKDLQKAQPHLTSKFKENAEKMIEKKQEFSKSNEPYKVAEEEETKVKEKIDSDKIVYQKANENVEGLKKVGADTTEAEAIRETARLSLAASTADFKKAKDKKDALKIKRDEAKKEYGQSRVPLMESLEGIDLSKNSTISSILADKNSIQAQALCDVIKEQSSDKIMRLISSLESKDVSGKRNFNETIKLKKDVGINLTERLFLDAGGGNEGIEAVLKMRTIDSSPAARAGGYNFNSLIDGADRKIIDESTGRLIKEMARKQLKGDKLMKELAENIKRDSGQSSSGKKTGGESSESEEEKKS